MFSFACPRWRAWAPGIDDHAGWQAWVASGQPLPDSGTAAVKAMPPLLRRRAVRLGRAALEAMYALDPAPSTQPMVFASRHGEVIRSLNLLKALAIEGAVSPQEFGMAVHNAIAGLFSIARKDAAPITALASENALTLSALQEVAAQLTEQSAVTLVLCDEPLPDLFEPYVSHEPFCVALAMTLTPGTEFTLSFHDAPAEVPNASASESIVAFLRFLLIPDQATLTLSADGYWSIRRTHPGQDG